MWDDSTIRTGTAKQILEQIVDKPTINAEISGMSVDQYAQALIDNAPYYLPKRVIEELSIQPFSTVYDRALSLLSVMPASGARILATDTD